MEEIENCCYSYHIMRIKPKIKNIYQSLYISLCFKNSFVHNQVCKKGVGDIRCVVSKKDVEELIIYLPIFEEQMSIVKIISSQDQKIEALEKEVALWEQKKKSLMQLLLTGIVRV